MSLESVALLFQSIFLEDRLTPLTRVQLARLQMPLIRLALAQPTMFGNTSSPGIDLVNLIVARALEQEGSPVSADAFELEIQRLVSMIEHSKSGETRPFTEASEAFNLFLSHYRQPDEALSEVSSEVSQQEQRDPLTVQYSVLLRRMLHGMPVSSELSDFLFKVWAQVLADSSVRYGHHHAQTQSFKQAVTALVWATGARKTRRNRARVIKDVPHLLQTLRDGMEVLGLIEDEKNRHITTLSTPMMDAFLNKKAPHAAPSPRLDDAPEQQTLQPKSVVRSKTVRASSLPGMEVTEDYPSSQGWHFWESVQAEQKDEPKPVEVTDSTWSNPRGHRQR